MAARSEAGRILNSGLLVVGKTIFWAESWLETWSFAYECPQSSRTPATSRTAARTSPPTLTSASKVLRRIYGASLTGTGPPGPVDELSSSAASRRTGGEGQGHVTLIKEDFGHRAGGPLLDAAGQSGGPLSPQRLDGPQIGTAN